MKRILALLGLLVLPFIAFGAAAALNPGEHVACATATVPAQTVAANGTAIGTIPGSGSVACTTATDQTVTLPGGTTTVTNTVTATSPTTTSPTTPPPPISDPLFGLCNGDCAGQIPATKNSQFKYVGGGYHWITSTWATTTIDYAEVGTCYDDGYASASQPGTQPTVTECVNNGWAQYRANGTVIQTTNPQNGNAVSASANPGNVAYQKFVIQKLLTHLAYFPAVDGIYFDNFAMDVCATNGGVNDTYPVYDSNHNVLYNNDYDFQTAELSFISAVSSALHSHGYQVGTNSRGYDCTNSAHNNGNGSNGADSNSGGTDKYWADRYAPYVDFAFLEEFGQWDVGSTFPSGVGCDTAPNGVQLSGTNAWCNQWDGWEQALEHSYAIGLNRYPVDYFANNASGQRQCRYLKGSQLLAWDGAHGGWGFNLVDYYNNGYRGCMDFDPGGPLNTRYSVFNTKCGSVSTSLSPCSVWRRDFTRGYVIVNPTQSAVTVGSDTIPSGDAVLHQN